MNETHAGDDRSKIAATTRREFLKRSSAGLSVVAGTAALGTSPAAWSASTDVASLKSALRTGALDEATLWPLVRYQFALDPRVTYMNVGTTGSMPRQVLDAYDDYNRRVAYDPRETFGGATRLREELAPGYGCNPHELVISGNTTEGMCMTLNGLVWDEFDAIITTNHEHPAGRAPIALLRDRQGVQVYEVTLPVGGEQSVDDYVALFKAKIDEARMDGYHPKLIVYSAPTYVSGTMLPIRAISDLAIAENVYTLCDGAHATGMFNLDFHALGVDFFAGSGHKWQCGPGGTGIWYIRNQTESNPLPLPPFYPTRTLVYDVFGGEIPIPDGARGDYDVGLFNQSHGNPNYPAYLALADVARFWNLIGRQRIEDYILDLSAYTKERIVAIWGAEALRCPTNPALQSALTSFVPLNAFDPEDNDPETGSAGFVTRLREEYGFVVRNTSLPMPDGETTHRPLRISTHLFHSRDDVDAVIEAVVDLAAKFERGE